VSNIYGSMLCRDANSGKLLGGFGTDGRIVPSGIIQISAVVGHQATVTLQCDGGNDSIGEGESLALLALADLFLGLPASRPAVRLSS
jgi:hypothetical protein